METHNNQILLSRNYPLGIQYFLKYRFMLKIRIFTLAKYIMETVGGGGNLDRFILDYF
jgi:hypothetical protein